MNVETPEQALIARQDAVTLRQALSRLPARLERVLRLWYGIGCEPMIFEDIGAQIGVCRGRAQQMAREAERRLCMPLLAKFRERPGAQRIRREIDEARQAVLRAREFAHEQHIINEERAAEQRRIDMVEAERQRVLREEASAEQRKIERRETERMREAERAQAERVRQRQGTVAEILRIAEEVELELDQIPRQRKQRVVNPFGFSAERALEYAEVLRALTLPHYRMRT